MKRKDFRLGHLQLYSQPWLSKEGISDCITSLQWLAAGFGRGGTLHINLTSSTHSPLLAAKYDALVSFLFILHNFVFCLSQSLTLN